MGRHDQRSQDEVRQRRHPGQGARLAGVCGQEQRESKGKEKSGGKAKGQGKNLSCCVRDGVHNARLCPSEGWVTTPTGDPSAIEQALDEGDLLEEEDEARQFNYLDTVKNASSPSTNATKKQEDVECVLETRVPRSP